MSLDCVLVHTAKSWRLWCPALIAKRFESVFVPAEVDRSSASDFIEKKRPTQLFTKLLVSPIAHATVRTTHK